MSEVGIKHVHKPFVTASLESVVVIVPAVVVVFISSVVSLLDVVNNSVSDGVVDVMYDVVDSNGSGLS